METFQQGRNHRFYGMLWKSSLSNSWNMVRLSHFWSLLWDFEINWEEASRTNVAVHWHLVLCSYMKTLAPTVFSKHKVLSQFKGDVFDHPPCTRDDQKQTWHHLFTHMKKWLGAQHFNDDEDLQKAVTHWLHFQAAKIHIEIFGILVKR